MNRPPCLPSRETDLATWGAYAGTLVQHGDARGTELAYELALPDVLEHAELAAFQARMQRQPEGMTIAFALGYVRAVRLGRYVSAVETSVLEAAIALLASERGRLVEQVIVPFAAAQLAQVAQLLGVLPPTCRRLALWACDDLDTAGARGLFARLPSHVVELSLSASRPRQQGDWSALIDWIDDRFDTVELPHLQWIPDHSWKAILARAARCERVVLRVPWFHPPLPAGRIELGRSGDAAVVDLQRREASALWGWDPCRLVDRYGQLPIRSQLALLAPERHEQYITTSAQRTIRGTLYFENHAGAWTVELSALGDDSAAVFVDGMPLGDRETMAIRNGQRLHGDGWSYRFVSERVTATVRELLA